jgi:hypothetical protein
VDDQSGNAMPAFGEQLSPHDMDMLVRWMTGDYHRTVEAAAAAVAHGGSEAE